MDLRETSRRIFLRSLGALQFGAIATQRAAAADSNATQSSISGEGGRRFLRRILSGSASQPIEEIGDDVRAGGGDSNVGDEVVTTIKSSATTATLPQGYSNIVDLTTHYTFLRNEAGFNTSQASNSGRSGIAAYRVRAIQSGQGDLYAFNASVQVNSARQGATHWLANPAGVLFAGTVIGAVDGAYLNPIEIFVTDKSASGTYNCTAVGAVYNLNRNRREGNSLGQVWSGIRVQSVGAEPVENMLSGTGKFTVGVDLSMPNLDFGPGKAAIAIKSGDRIYFNATAGGQQSGGIFLRANWAMTSGSGEFCEYDAQLHQWRIALNGNTAFAVTSETVLVPSLTIAGQRIFSGRQATGWNRMIGAEDHASSLHTDTVTLEQLARRVKALESALHRSGGFNALLSD